MIFNTRNIENFGIAFLLSILSGIILLLSWISPQLFFLLFIAFIPLFYIFDKKVSLCRNLFLQWVLVYLAMFLWNLDNAWIMQVDKTGGLIVLFIHPVLLSLPFILLIAARNKSFLLQFSLFISSWLFFEWLLQQWELAFPLLNLGLGLGSTPRLIQWYEFTGAEGGSLWILLVNIAIYAIVNSILASEVKFIYSLVLSSLLAIVLSIPIWISVHIFRNYDEQGPSIEVAGLDTHLNCLTVKYSSGNDRLLDSYLRITREAVTRNTVCVVWPETALPEPIYISNLNKNQIIKRIRDSLHEYTSLKIISGIVLREQVTDLPNGRDIRFDTLTGCAFREYNAAIQIEPSSPEIEVKTKERCVPATERVPYPKVLSFLSKYVKSLAGYSFSTSDLYGQTLFGSSGKLCIRPLLCYETAFPDVINDSLQRNTIFCLLMNEGWYHNLKVSERFMNISIIRAIENRRSIIRSSNQGISGTVNQKGVSSVFQGAFGTHVFRANLNANANTTFYCKYFKSINALIVVSFLISALFAINFKS
jgi:apolipoprotein N-acyltransferase